MGHAGHSLGDGPTQCLKVILAVAAQMNLHATPEILDIPEWYATRNDTWGT